MMGKSYLKRYQKVKNNKFGFGKFVLQGNEKVLEVTKWCNFFERVNVRWDFYKKNSY